MFIFVLAYTILNDFKVMVVVVLLNITADRTFNKRKKGKNYFFLGGLINYYKNLRFVVGHKNISIISKFILVALHSKKKSTRNILLKVVSY